MRGVRAKILRGTARGLTTGKPERQQEVVHLPERYKWVDVPDDGEGFLERLRNKALRLLGVPTPTKRERQLVAPTVVREKKGTTRSAYKRLKRIYYRMRSA